MSLRNMLIIGEEKAHIIFFPNRIDIVRFGPKGVLTALKRVYLVKRSLYIYSARNFLSYPMWDITNTLPCRHNVLVVSHGIARSNRQTPLTGSNKPPTPGSGIGSDTICNDLFNQINADFDHLLNL